MADATINIPCIELKQGQHTFYVGKIKAKELHKIAVISRRKPKEREGYQRMFSPIRVKSVAKFLNNGNVIPVSILVTFDDAKFKNNTLQIKNKKQNGWIIDGQHRLLGAVESGLDIELPLVAFIKLGTEEQINQFITINREAKGVPSSLYIDLLGEIPKSKTITDLAKERVADVARILNDDETSPFHNRIVVVTAPKKGQLSLANFNRKTEQYFVPTKGFLAEYDPELQAKLISNYFLALEHVYKKEADAEVPIFYQTLAFGAFMGVFNRVFTQVITDSGGFMLKDIIDLFKTVGKLPFDNWRKYGTGAKGEASAAQDINQAITAAYKTAKKTALKV